MVDTVVLMTEATDWGDLAKLLLASLGAEVTHVAWSWGEDVARLETAYTECGRRPLVCFERVLARRFQVSLQAMRYRLDQLGLYEPLGVAA